MAILSIRVRPCQPFPYPPLSGRLAQGSLPPEPSPLACVGRTDKHNEGAAILAHTAPGPTVCLPAGAALRPFAAVQRRSRDENHQPTRLAQDLALERTGRRSRPTPRKPRARRRFRSRRAVGARGFGHRRPPRRQYLPCPLRVQDRDRPGDRQPAGGDQAQQRGHRHPALRHPRRVTSRASSNSSSRSTSSTTR